MSQTNSDYQKKQSRPSTGHEQLYRNLGIALPFFGFASNIVYTIIQQQLDNAERERAIERMGIANNKPQKVGSGSIDQGRAEDKNACSFEAIEKLEQELSIATQKGDMAGVIRAYRTLGSAYRKRKDLKTSIKYHERELDIAKEVGDKAEERRAYENLGIAHRCDGDIKQAMGVTHSSLA